MSAKETKACATLARCAALPRYHRVPLSKRKRPRKRPVRKVRAPMPADPGTSDRVECEPTTLRAYPPRKGRKAREGQEPRWACSEHPVGAVLLPSAGSSLLIHLADRLSSREYGPLPPVVRSSGFIQLSYSTKLETRTARRQHGAPPPVLKSDWRRCGRLVAPLVAQGDTELKNPCTIGRVGGRRQRRERRRRRHCGMRLRQGKSSSKVCSACRCGTAAARCSPDHCGVLFGVGPHRFERERAH